MEKKQSSIDWLIGQIIFKTEFANLPNQYILMSDKNIDGIIEQAKEMHKEEVISSYKNAMASAYFNTHNWMPQEGYIHKAEYYYNETFGGNNE